MTKAEINRIAAEEAKASVKASREAGAAGYCGNERVFDNSANDAEHAADLAADRAAFDAQEAGWDKARNSVVEG